MTADRPVALVLRALGLGDLLAVVPALRGVRSALPGHRLVLAAPRALASLVDLIGAVDALHDLSQLGPLRWTGPPPRVAVNLHGRGPQSHQVLRETGAHRLVAFGEARREPFGETLGETFGETLGEPASDRSGPAWREDEHEVQRWCRLVREGLGARCDPDDLDLAVPDLDSPWPDAVVIHPGAAYGSRRWPARRFAATARWLAGQGHDVVVTGSAAELPLAQAVAREAGLPARHVLAGGTSLVALAALVAGARLVVSGDTGVAHLATAYRRRSVVLFGPTPPTLWGPPPRPQHVVLWRGRRGGDPWAERIDPALLALDVDSVLAAARRVLGAPCGVPSAQAVQRTTPRAASHGPGSVGGP